MDSRILGVPLVLILLVLAIIVPVGAINVMLHTATIRQLSDVKVLEMGTEQQLNALQISLNKPTPTASPTATITPYTKFKAGVASPSGLTPTPKK